MVDPKRHPAEQPRGPSGPVSEPVDEEAMTVPLEGEGVIAQEPSGPGNREGGGEWPDPDTPPRGPSPG